MLLSQFQMHNGLVKECSIMKMFSKKWRIRDYVEYMMQVSHSQQRHWDIRKNVLGGMNKNNIILQRMI